jgi:hypothetical protein
MPEGFESYNDFDQKTTNINQLYDLTLSLYKEEHERIKTEFGNPDRTESMRTIIGEIEHNISKNINFLKSYYPDRLRELLLIYLITILEGFLTELVEEIFTRDTSPFKRQGEMTLHKGHALSLTSVYEIKDIVISKDKRRLGKNSISENSDFFESRFGISFEETSVDTKELKEIHERRNLHVHNNGVCDNQYSRRYDTDFEPGDTVSVDHEYFLYAVDTINTFGEDLANKCLSIFPKSKRKKTVYDGINENIYSKEKALLVRFDADEATAFEEDISGIELRGYNADRYIRDIAYQFINKEGRCILIIGGEAREVGRAIKAIKTSDHLTFRMATDLLV